MEDPIILRFNIEHYKTLLKYEKDGPTRRTIETLMAEAEETLEQVTARGRHQHPD